jgi:hypothetical protein
MGEGWGSAFMRIYLGVFIIESVQGDRRYGWAMVGVNRLQCASMRDRRCDIYFI